MVPIVPEEWAGPADAGCAPVDPLRRAVHVALAIYLMPVVAIVCAIGGASIVLDRASRLAARLATEGRRGVGPGPHPLARPGEAGRTPSVSSGRRRTRVGH